MCYFTLEFLKDPCWTYTLHHLFPSVANISRKHTLFVYVHVYADDTQLNKPFDFNDPNDEMSARKQAEACILEIKSWMSRNKLKLNDERTEFLIMNSKYQQRNIQGHSINVGTATIHASKSARNLEIIVFNDSFSRDQHIKHIYQSVYFHIRNVYSIRKILTDETITPIIHALITSRMAMEILF